MAAPALAGFLGGIAVLAAFAIGGIEKKIKDKKKKASGYAGDGGRAQKLTAAALGMSTLSLDAANPPSMNTLGDAVPSFQGQSINPPTTPAVLHTIPDMNQKLGEVLKAKGMPMHQLGNDCEKNTSHNHRTEVHCANMSCTGVPAFEDMDENKSHVIVIVTEEHGMNLIPLDNPATSRNEEDQFVEAMEDMIDNAEETNHDAEESAASLDDQSNADRPTDTFVDTMDNVWSVASMGDLTVDKALKNLEEAGVKTWVVHEDELD